jgi:hypothetical protein
VAIHFAEISLVVIHLGLAHWIFFISVEIPGYFISVGCERGRFLLADLGGKITLLKKPGKK